MTDTRIEPMPRLAPDVEDLYDHAPCGYVTTLPDGLIVDVNETFLAWTGHRREDLVGVRRFADLLPRGARAFHVTHHLPALAHTGEMREVASEIVRADGGRMAVMLSSTLRHDADGTTDLIRTTVTDATARRRYERELLASRDREQAARRQAEERGELLARRAREQVAIAEVSRLALADVDAEAVVGRVGRTMQDALDVDAVRLLAREETRPGADDAVVVTIRDGDAAHRLLLERRGRAFCAEERDFLDTLANVAALALERRRLDERHRHLALHDPLTGLPNRTLLFDRLHHALRRARRRGTRVGVLLVDLDGFKAINDALGHHAGDETLRVVARRFAAVLRSSDTVGRLGGDEFAVICEGVTDDRDAEHVVGRLARTLEAAPITLDGEDRWVAASIGLVVGEGTDDPEDLLREADRAMYREKARAAGPRRP